MRVGRVTAVDSQDVQQVFAQLRVLDRKERLHAPVEIARHQVRTAHVQLFCPRIGKIKDAAVLEEAPDQRGHADALADSRYAGSQAADAAYDKIDPYAGTGGAIERGDDATIDERVHLKDQEPALALRYFALDQAHEPPPHVHRRHQQPAVFVLVRVSREVVEELGDVGAQLGPRRHDAEVGVPTRRGGIIVPGAQVDVP